MISYEGKVVLAPMVRVGTLPMRILALKYGADLVWSPETVDKKLIGCQRTHNTILNTYDYLKDNRLVFRTHPSEKGKLVMQLGSSDPELALQAAMVVKDDVSGIDLNCGCPKHFSVHAGMGAALLTTPHLLTSILKKLVNGLPDMPITAKIRVLPDREATMELVKAISVTGIKALTVHCRTPAERPRHPAHYDLLPEIVKLCPFPVIANGDIYTREDFMKVKEMTGVSSLMLARSAQWNVSIFRSEGPIPLLEVTQDYLMECIRFDNQFQNTKYTVLQMYLDRPHSDHPFTKKLQQAKTMEDLCALFNIEFTESEMEGDSLLYNDGEDED